MSEIYYTVTWKDVLLFFFFLEHCLFLGWFASWFTGGRK